MGYESRISIMVRHTYEETTEQNGIEITRKRYYNESLASFNMRKVDEEIINVFKTDYNNGSKIYSDDEATTDLYLGGGLEVFKKDPYGDVPKEAPIADLIKALAICSSACGYYRRYAMLLGFLASLNPYDWGHEVEFIAVHTGYQAELNLMGFERCNSSPAFNAPNGGGIYFCLQSLNC